MCAVSDLIVLAAGKDEEHVVRGLLSRPAALGIRPVRAQFVVHPHHDAGCLRACAGILRSYLREASRALVIFDRKGCGAEDLTAELIAARVEAELGANGWSERAAAVVLDPEIEVWAWSDSPEVDGILGWQEARPSLREWLVANGYWPTDAAKPSEPRRAYLDALAQAKAPRSPVRFEQIGARVSVRRCTDPAFEKLLTTLRSWFPPDQDEGDE